MKMEMPEALTSIALIALTGLACWLFNSPFYLFLLVLIFAVGNKGGKQS